MATSLVARLPLVMTGLAGRTGHDLRYCGTSGRQCHLAVWSLGAILVAKGQLAQARLRAAAMA
jgi:hypothetical protein